MNSTARHHVSWIAAALAFTMAASADPITVQHTEALVRAFLVVRTTGGDTIAGGELRQYSADGTVTSRLTFHFQDGSLHDETAVFTQDGKFRLLSYHLTQTGPRFPTPMDLAIDTRTNRAIVTYTKDGKQKVAKQEEKLPADLANGLVPILAKNIVPGTAETEVSMLVTTPEPRLVKLKISADGTDRFTSGGVEYKATRYVIKVDIGGITGVLAEALGKDPPDSRIWIAQGDSPGFVRAERPFYMGAPLWRIELAAASW